jgi:hypothetical protein
VQYHFQVQTAITNRAIRELDVEREIQRADVRNQQLQAENQRRIQQLEEGHEHLTEMLRNNYYPELHQNTRMSALTSDADGNVHVGSNITITITSEVLRLSHFFLFYLMEIGIGEKRIIRTIRRS